MIARIWRGAVRSEDADAYARYMEKTGVASYVQTPGNRGAYMLRRDLGGLCEFVMVTFWESLESIKEFAGEDHETAVFYPQDDRFLLERDLRSRHFDVAAAVAPMGAVRGGRSGEVSGAPREARARALKALDLRPATTADVPRLAQLAQAAYGHYVERLGGPPRPMTDDYAEIVQRQAVIVAERGGQLVGMIVLGVGDDGFALDNVAVDPAHQGNGIGKVLLERAEQEARQAGFDSIYLYTHEKMSENLALYSRLGYAEFDRRQHGAACLVYLRKTLG
ncbi:MAG: GNAT family N-acetyltransferase [Actinomycetota bacterium]|nr:GNAT family N-acetyltransferase [Actinomycetota bacterium]